jgi:hypothetical protein
MIETIVYADRVSDRAAIAVFVALSTLSVALIVIAIFML